MQAGKPPFIFKAAKANSMSDMQPCLSLACTYQFSSI